MLCSSIVKAKQSHPNYFKESLVPALWDSELSSIRGVQELIMQAWQGGMDVAGAELLNWDIIGTKKWIGATGESDIRVIHCCFIFCTSFMSAHP
jgi:hypothetical protein